MIRYVVRPQSILTTPRLLRDCLGANRTVSIPGSARTLSLKRDFFLTYPDESRIEEFNPHTTPRTGLARTRTRLPTTPEEYSTVRQFTSVNKANQRRYLGGCGIPVPDTYTSHRQVAVVNEPGRFVVRPLSHRAGIGYRITDRADDFVEGQEYTSRLYPKAHEYRVIFCFGTPIITLYKRVPESADRDGPWNHACGSSFVTVNNIDNNRLRHTDVYDRLKEFDVIKHAHLCAADIMLGKERGDYVVCELNFCPSITIESNLEKVRAHVASILR